MKMKWRNQRVVITGGAGLVGLSLAKKLHTAGADVHAVDSLHTGREELLPDGVTFHEADIRSQAVNSVIETVDPTVLYHLAAIHYIPYCNSYPEETFETNVLGTRRVLEAARSIDSLTRVVFASTAGVYAPQRKPHKEIDPTEPIDIYEQTKLLGETVCQLFNSDTNVSIVSARLFNIYGAEGTNDHLTRAILSQVQDGSRTIELGNLEPARDFIHVNDIRDALVRLVVDHEENGEYRVYYVGTGTKHSVREVVSTAETALGEESYILQDQARVRETDRPHLCADIERIKSETNWTPSINLAGGIQRLLEADRITV